MEEQAKRLLTLIGALLLFAALSAFSLTAVNGGGKKEEIVRVWIFDVGQGDAIFIDAPEGQILIDGGPSGEVLEKLARVLPPWDRKIDAVINTHPHADHVTGLVHVLERFEVSRVFDSGQDYDTDIFLTFEENYRPLPLIGGSVIELGGGAKLEILAPKMLPEKPLKDPNAGSVVALLTYGETTILLTGDIDVEGEKKLMEDLPHIDVLKVAHQGSRTSSDESFLQAISPNFAIITVGENTYGHPHPEIVERLMRTGAMLFRTDWHGDIRIRSIGDEPEVQAIEL